jgi:pilus assembly protein CpaC
MKTRILSAIVLFALCFGTLFAAAAESPGTLNVEAGSQTMMRETRGITRVAIGNPDVADVNVINRTQLLVTGKSTGRTTLMVWTSGAKAAREYRVVVGTGNEPALVTNPASITSHQVQTDIKVAEMSRTALKQYGLNYINQNRNTWGYFVPGGLSSVQQGATQGQLQLGSTAGFVPLGDAFNLVFGNHNGAAGILSLLEQRGLVHVLAEPTLVAMSGQTASFLAGGEFPVPVQQGSGAGTGTTGGITIEFKEFGVRLQLTPTVLANDRIVLRVAPEVSELNFNAAITTGGVQVPALTVRRTETTVELGDGESFLISGLVSQSTLANVDKVPWLGNVPILGAFFKSNRFNREDKELVMLVTPRLVKPLRKGAQLPALPGSAYNGYNPNSANLMFFESGKYDPAGTGFSW